MRLPDEQRVFDAIFVNPGHRQSFYEAQLGMPYRVLEDVMWTLWESGAIQINADSTIRVTRVGERAFRHIL